MESHAQTHTDREQTGDQQETHGKGKKTAETLGTREAHPNHDTYCWYTIILVNSKFDF